MSVSRQTFTYDELHPTVQQRYRDLSALVAISSPLRPFEGYRSPKRQDHLFALQNTKARGWQSAHQYGLAVDYVGFVNNEWTWDLPFTTWDFLRECATKCGLRNTIQWDRPHVEAPEFTTMRAILRG